MASKPTMAFTFVESVLVAVHLESPPMDDEWARYCAETYRVRKEMRGCLVHTLGGGPNSKQREQVRLAFDGTRPPPVAVMTGSTLVRGIITSLNWFLDNQLAAFTLSDFDGAFRHLAREGCKVDRPLLLQIIERLSEQLEQTDARLSRM